MVCRQKHKCLPQREGILMLRAVDRIRTDDLRITRAPLYRLSYNGIPPQLGHRLEYSEIASKCKLQRLSGQP